MSTLLRRGADVREIGSELGATHALVGDLAGSEGRVLLRLQLLDADDGTVVWSGVFDRQAGDLADLQRELAAHVAAHLSAVLRPRPEAPPRQQLPPAVAGEYAKARYLLLRSDPGSAAAALPHLFAVVRAAPEHADAHAAIADAWVHHAPPAWGRAQRAAERALELDPYSTVALRVRGMAAMYRDWDWDAAGRLLRRAAEVPGADAEAHVAHASFLTTLGRHAEALAQADQALDLDPLAALLRTDVAYVYYLAGRYREAREHAEEAIALHADATGLLIDILLALGDLDGAARHMGIAWPAGDAGDGEELERAWLEAKRRDWKALPAGQRPSPAVAASVAIRLGEAEVALGLLEEAVRARSLFAPYLMVDPDFVDVRAHPLFQALLRVTGHPHAQASADHARDDEASSVRVSGFE